MYKTTVFWTRVLCLYLLILPAAIPRAGGQNREGALRSFDRPTWERAVRGLNYKPKKTVERKPERSRLEPKEEEKSPEKTQKLGWLTLPIWLVLALRALGIALGIGLLLLLLRGLLALEWTGRTKQQESTGNLALQLEKIEENPGAFNLMELIGRAEEAGQYMLAVRLHYLATLNALSLRGLIRWKKNKTNGDYLRELQSTPWHPSFSELTLAFEEIWYGEQSVEAWRYQELKQLFLSFAEQLNAGAGTKAIYAAET